VLTVLGLVAMIAVGTCVSFVIDRYVPGLEDLFHWVGVDFPLKGANEAIADMVRVSPLPLALFVVAVRPALCEELLCRGFIGYGLGQRYRAVPVVLMTSFLFGCLHVEPKQALGAMFLGVAMHFAYLAARSLWVSMALHFFNNGLGVVTFHYKDTPFAVLEPLESILENGSPGVKALYFLASFVLFAAVAYAFYQTRCKLVSIDPELPTWEPPGVSTAELPPKGSGAVVTHDPISTASVLLVAAASIAFGLVLALA